MSNPFQSFRSKSIRAAILLVVWIVLAGDYGLAVISAGALIIPGVLLPDYDAPGMPQASIIRRGLHLTIFLLSALTEIFISSYKLAYYACNPGISLKSSIIAYDISLENRLGILLLSTFITLTPGTLVLDIAAAENRFYIHTLSPLAEERMKELLIPVRRMESRLRRACG